MFLKCPGINHFGYKPVSQRLSAPRRMNVTHERKDNIYNGMGHFREWPVVEKARIPSPKDKTGTKLKEWAKRHATSQETGCKSLGWNEARGLASSWSWHPWGISAKLWLELFSKQRASKKLPAARKKGALCPPRNALPGCSSCWNYTQKHWAFLKSLSLSMAKIHFSILFILQ